MTADSLGPRASLPAPGPAGILPAPGPAGILPAPAAYLIVIEPSLCPGLAALAQ